MIPLKKSNKWIGVFIFYTLVIFIALLTTRIILDSELIGKYILSLLLISLTEALIPCVSGFLGKRGFFLIFTACTLVGILYMFYVAIGNTAPGWGDLTSIIGMIFIVATGAALGLVTEVVIHFVNKYKHLDL